MGSGAIIGLLAAFTIGGTRAAAIFHVGFCLRDPRNRSHAKWTLVHDQGFAHTDHDATGGRPLIQRLQESKASTTR